MTTTADRDYYEVLGIPRSADDKAVRSAYRRLARQYHPDVNKSDPNAERRFKEVSAAYEVLSDPKKRSLYDRFGHNWQQAQRMEEQGIPFDQATRGPGGAAFDVSNLGDLLEGMFGAGRGGVGGRTRVAGRAEVQVTLDEAYNGTRRVLELQAHDACPQCRGVGRTGNRLCAACQGQGQVIKPVRIEADIPPGVDTGSQVRLNVRGQPLVLVINVQPDPRFRCEGADLYARASVPLYIALLGGEVMVPTIRGQASLTVPEGTQNGQVFRLSGQGMPVLGGAGRRGNLFVTAQVVLPSKLSTREKELVRQLRAAGGG
ncbi:MAG: J domain-containing protein [SAR202 cluster bacterium]|nr:J domain-containing protein [SAR202 cluster bacterium]